MSAPQPSPCTGRTPTEFADDVPTIEQACVKFKTPSTSSKIRLANRCGIFCRSKCRLPAAAKVQIAYQDRC